MMILHYESLSPHVVLVAIGHLLFGSFCHHNVPMFPFEQLPQPELVEQVLPPFRFPFNTKIQLDTTSQLLFNNRTASRGRTR